MHGVKIVSVIALAAVAVGLLIGSFTPRAGAAAVTQTPGEQKDSVVVVTSDRNDVSPPLRDLPIIWPSGAKSLPSTADENAMTLDRHGETADPTIKERARQVLPSALSDPILNFSGIPFTGSGGAPDPNGAAGATQYVQVVKSAYQVFDKSTGASVLGPNSLDSLWVGFGGVCQSNGGGTAIVLYDHLANRWIIAQPAGAGTHECIAVSTTSDATGTYNRYDVNFGTNFFTNPRLSVWPDAYYMSRNVFNSSGVYLGPQAVAFNRAAMLAGAPATAITPGITGGPNEESFLPAHLDGPNLPPAGAPNTFVAWPGGNNANNYKLFHFHVDFAVPANSTFTQFGPLVAAAPFTQICPGTLACVPQLGTTTSLDAIGNRLMFRLAYRNSGTHESIVGNFTVSAGGVAGIRWFELRNVTAGPVTAFQEGTYQPDSTWRWLGSAAMDGNGNLAVGFSASSSSFNPQIRYAGRNVGDPLNTLTSEKLLYAGTGSQTGGSSWGTFSCLTIDPTDDTTFWYTNEYYESDSASAWRTRIGSFKFPSAPVPVSAFSRKTHGGAGSFDLPLPLSGNVGIECRNGPTYQMIINFATPVTASGATVTSGTGSVGGFSLGGSQITVDLTGVTDAQRIALTLSNVSDGTNTGNVVIPMGVLVGDTNADGVVNAGDALQTRSRSGQAADATSFRSDVNTDGFVNSGDTLFVRARSGAFLP